MAPAEPPDPMPWKRPFQASGAGSQTSKPISDPGSGRDTPATRQKATSSTVKPREENVSGGVNGGVTSSATVRVTWGRPSGARATAAQAAPAAASWARAGFGADPIHERHARGGADDYGQPAGGDHGCLATLRPQHARRRTRPG